MTRLVNMVPAFAMIFATAIASGQIVPEKAGSIRDSRFVLKIADEWNDQQRAELANLYELDSLLMRAVFSKDISFINDSTEWSALINSEGMLEISKTIGGQAGSWSDNIILSWFPEFRDFISLPGIQARYGVNQFTLSDIFSYRDGVACFFLPSSKEAKKVFLAGTFNQWSTMQLPMHQTDSGWVACIRLPPGKHLYRYIVDGRWMTDPNNRLRERESRRIQNSVVYCYNHLFYLEGHQDANRVVVSGSFNGWNHRELQMGKSGAGWQLPIYLGEGTHAYKFIVDDRWITDPANPVARMDADGNMNSFLGIGDSITFRLRGYEEARKVLLAGTFNSWSTNELVMDRTDDGWELPYVLSAGNYEYKFIADGQWMPDPDNPFTTGSGDYTNSFMVFNPNHMFVLEAHDNASRVIVSGSFNSWNPNEYRMVYRGGEWVFPIYLPPGRHSYKFVVDGNWILDPANSYWEDNEYGTGNSVLWIEF